MKKMIIWITAVTITFNLLLTVPVMAEDPEVIESIEATESTQYMENSYYPITVTDQAGREVTIEKEPERIVSGYYISTSLVLALGLEEKLVGIEGSADKRPIYKMSAPQLLDLPNVGSLKEFDLEGCAALEADLVILPMKLKDSAAILEELGFTVVIVYPESQELLKEMTELIGKATHTEEKAQELLDFIEAQALSLAEKMENAELPAVYMGGNSDFLSTASKGMYQNELITMAGGRNVAGEIDDTYWVQSSYEQILSWDPEYIILASNANYTVEDVLTDEKLAVCTAIQNENVYHIPDNLEAWDSPVPSGILGAVWLSGILHPEINAEDECQAVIEEYYKTFYGVELIE